MTSKTAIIVTLALLSARPAFAGRVISTPFAETTKEGTYKISVTALEEARSSEKGRWSYRLDLGLAGRTELGVLVSAPDDRPTTTQVNLQHKLLDETPSRPTVSVGVWDVGHIDRFSGQETGGSFFIGVSKTLTLSEGRPPAKLSLGAGTNKLEGIFGGVILPLNARAGVMAEYVAENSRSSGADAVNAAVYYFTNPTTRLRLSWSGGNPGIDINIGGTWR